VPLCTTVAVAVAVAVRALGDDTGEYTCGSLEVRAEKARRTRGVDAGKPEEIGDEIGADRGA
jgi:hypothetical protein